MVTLIIAEDCMDPGSWIRKDVDDTCKALKEHFDIWPSSARLYHEEVALSNDVTPYDDNGIEKLQTLNGTIYCIVYPGEPITLITLAVVAVVAILAVVAMVLLKPKPEIPNSVAEQGGGRNSTSPNNDLSERKNTPRLGGRIPDIYGTVRSIPDLISVPYLKFINHQEIEYNTMCIGRGAYEVTDFKDDTTLITDIAGSSIEVYGPGKSPNNGDLPELSIGEPIVTNIRSPKRITAVNGQTLRPPNEATYNSINDVFFSFPNEIRSTINPEWGDKWQPGESLIVTNASALTHLSPSGTATRDFSGTYTILTVDDDVVTLTSPSTVNAAWLGFTTTDVCAAKLSVSGPRWVGPFTVSKNADPIDRFLTNFVAPNGLYYDDGTNQTSNSVKVELEVTPVDVDDNALSGPELFAVTVEGSAVLRTTRARSFEFNPFIDNPLYRIRARRITDTFYPQEGSLVDEVKWRDLYLFTDLGGISFGNVTILQSVTAATAGALAVKDRKLNLLATRKLPQRISGSSFTATLHPTISVADIFSAICLDPYIGNRTNDEIDFDSVYDTIDAVETYFGTPKAAMFNNTFDNDNMSFEETAVVVADAAFCTAYRRGSQLKLFFEKKTPDSTLLFNHRNKVPGTEVRTIRFGNDNDNDGIEYEYTSPVSDEKLTYYVPEDQSAINPKKIQGVGIRSKIHAHFHAYRIWNKMRYQNIAAEFDALQEAELTIPGERVLIADNTRTGTQDGHIESQTGLILTTSQDVAFLPDVNYSVYLQLYDQTIENIAVVAGSVPDEIVLAAPPSLPLVVNNDRWAKTTYQVVAEDNASQIAFLINEKTPKENLTLGVKAGNYDDRFYQNDTDFINGLITEETGGDFYSGPYVLIINYIHKQLNLKTYIDSLGSAPTTGSVQIIINNREDPADEAYIYSDNPNIPALTIGDWPAGMTISVINKAPIYPAGGTGGEGGNDIAPHTNGFVGTYAGDGINAEVSGITLTIDNQGSVFGGGGGGGGGGASTTTDFSVWQGSGGGGGGGGQGYGTVSDGTLPRLVPGGLGGISSWTGTGDPIIAADGFAGGTGSTAGAGTGGPTPHFNLGIGGSGGAWGLNGVTGGDSKINGSTFPGTGGAGGKAGFSIVSYSGVTILNTGTITGTQLVYSDTAKAYFVRAKALGFTYPQWYKRAVNQFILDCTSILSKLSLLYIMRNMDEACARINLINSVATSDLGLSTYTVPTFAQWNGSTGASGKGYQTLLRFTAMPGLSLNNQGCWSWVRTAGALSNPVLGVVNGTNSTRVVQLNPRIAVAPIGAVQGRMGAITSSNTTATVANRLGFRAVMRADASNQRIYGDSGALMQSFAVAAGTFGNAFLNIFATTINAPGTEVYADDTVSYFGMTQNLTDAEVVILRNALATLDTAINNRP